MKLINLSDVKDLSPEQRKASIDKKKREYREMLKGICPSKDIRALAKRLAGQDDRCDKCAYCNDPLCIAPYSDAYMEDMEIDPCYEGVLLFLKNEMVKAHESAQVKTLEQEMAEMEETLIGTLEAIEALTGYISRVEDYDLGMRLILSNVKDEMRDAAREMLDDIISK